MAMKKAAAIKALTGRTADYVFLCVFLSAMYVGLSNRDFISLYLKIPSFLNRSKHSFLSFEPFGSDRASATSGSLSMCLGSWVCVDNG